MAYPTVRSGNSQGVAVSKEVLEGLRVTGDAQLGSASSSLLAFYGGTAVDQPAAVTDVTTTASTTTTPYGYTSTQADAIVASLNAVIARLRENGLIAT